MCVWVGGCTNVCIYVQTHIHTHTHTYTHMCLTFENMEWGDIGKALVTKDWGRMKGLVIQFACATTTLALLNATLKYYISTLREQVGWARDAHTRADWGAGDAHTSGRRTHNTSA